jgi:Helix-turn-helix domain
MSRIKLDEALLTLKDIQKHSKLSLRTLQRHVQNGKLPVLRFGRSIRVEPGAYARFLKIIREGN